MGRRRKMVSESLGVGPVAGVPMVRVLDEGGREVMRGWYVRHESRQPCLVGDALLPEDVHHVVVCDAFADWGMPREMRASEVTSPHRIEVVREGDSLERVALDALRAINDAAEDMHGSGMFSEAQAAWRSYGGLKARLSELGVGE